MVLGLVLGGDLAGAKGVMIRFDGELAQRLTCAGG